MMNEMLQTEALAYVNSLKAPAAVREIAAHLQLDGTERKQLREYLREWESQGRIRVHKGGRFGPPRKIGSGAGRDKGATLVCKAGGHWFLRKESLTGLEEWKVPAGTTGNALPGDVVGYRKIPAPRGRMGGNWACIDGLKQRSTIPVVGQLKRVGARWMLSPHTSGWPDVIETDIISVECVGAEEGDIVEAALVEWRSVTAPVRVRVTERISRGDEPGADMASLIRRNSLPTTFPPDVEQEAATLPNVVSFTKDGKREDWREATVVTIDPFDAKDFDDAFHVERTAEGGWVLAIHIADVSHFIKPGGAMDTEARKRGNSVYLADRVIPMLPEKLSNGLCSLVPGEDRFTALALITLTSAAAVKSTRFARAVIRSAKRYNYEEAHARMTRDKKKDSGDRFDAHLDIAWELATKMRVRRRDRGALEMEFPEVKIILDDRGHAVDIRRIDYDESHQMIEEFMLAANEAVARYLKKRVIPAIHRVHDEPDRDRLWDFQQLASDYGHQAPDVSTPAGMKQLAGWIQQIAGRPEEHLLKLALLKSMKRAVYSEVSTPHFGLATDSYLHFTSPIRRYADLVAHRALFEGKVGPSSDLTGLARHLSGTERVAAEAEQESKRIKQLEYLDRISRLDEPRIFQAVAVGARPFGLLIELTDYFIKGLIRREDLPGAPWRYFADDNRYSGKDGSIGRGDRFQVKVLRVNLDKEWVDFAPVGEAIRDVKPRVKKSHVEPSRERRRNWQKPRR